MFLFNYNVEEGHCENMTLKFQKTRMSPQFEELGKGYSWQRKQTIQREEVIWTLSWARKEGRVIGLSELDERS